MPTATSGGALGIGAGPSLPCNSSGGMPNKMHNWFVVCRRLISNSEIWAWVCSRVLRAWYTSNWLVVPPWKRASVIRSVSCCNRTFSSAHAMRPWRVRICT